ncbi:hypothetical protein A4R44_08869 [Amycolatopsis sp. M39]|nr:hypothetical protein A4R44_08869 [Amycolatopsis sp. M39]
MSEVELACDSRADYANTPWVEDCVFGEQRLADRIRRQLVTRLLADPQ